MQIFNSFFGLNAFFSILSVCFIVGLISSKLQIAMLNLLIVTM